MNLFVGIDYKLSKTVLEFPSGSVLNTTRCTTVSIIDDAFVESEESFLILPSSAELFQMPQTTVFIQDNDGKRQTYCSTE